MSRPSASNDHATTSNNAANDSNKPAKPSTSMMPSTSGRVYDVSRRAVPSTRTPLNYGITSGAGTSSTSRKRTTSGPSRPPPSQTAPAAAINADAHLPPINTKTVGAGARRTKNRVPTAPQPQSTRQRLDSTHSQRESSADADKSFLSVPDSQNRESAASSSFYTDPSSYYSAESNLSFLGGMNQPDSDSPDIPPFRPPAMPTPSIPPIPTNIRLSTSTGNSMPEPSRQSTSDSAAYANYPPWLANSINAPPMPTLEQHSEATEESANEDGDEENAPDEWEHEGDRDDGWQMPEPTHYHTHSSDPGDEGENADGHGVDTSMPKPEHQMTMPMPNTTLHHDDDRIDDFEPSHDMNRGDSTIRMPSHPHHLPSQDPHAPSHSTSSLSMPSTPSRLPPPPLPITIPSRFSQSTSSPTNLSPTTRRAYGSNIIPPIVIPPPPKTPPPVPSPEKRHPSVGLAVGGLWNQPVGAHAHQHPSFPQQTRPPSERPTSQANTAPLRIQHHGKPSMSTHPDADAPSTTTSAISHAQGQATTTSAGGLGASGGRRPAVVSSSAPSTTSTQPQKAPTTVTITSNSRLERPNTTTSVAGTIPTLASSRPNTHLGAGPSNAPGSSSHKPVSTTSTNPTYPPISQSNAGGRPSISAPQPMKVSTSTGSQGKPFAEKISAAPSSSGHAETMQTSSTAALATAGGSGQHPTRPHLAHGTPSQMDTQYVNMLLALDDIPTTHNLLASFFNWILLAGFILFPGTFTSLQNLSAANGGQVPDSLVNTVTRLPLFIVAWVCCGIGAAGMSWLWWRWRKNYIWALNKVFAPALLNSLAGLLSTIASVFGAQHGQFSATSKSTLIVTTVSTVLFLILTLVYSLWLVRRVKRRHDREVGMERAGKHGEGIVDVSKRRARV